MIQMQTKLVVADNTGAKEVSMIRRLGQRTRIAHVGDVIVVHIPCQEVRRQPYFPKFCT